MAKFDIEAKATRTCRSNTRHGPSTATTTDAKVLSNTSQCHWVQGPNGFANKYQLTGRATRTYEVLDQAQQGKLSENLARVIP